jgi:CRP-like cAMP-binding protein
MATVENFARRVTRLNVRAGEVVIREGEPGDAFYLVSNGVLDVTSRDGRAEGAMTSGDCFGEIALLRDVPRTATVTARTDSVLYSLERDTFLLAIGAHPRSAETAHGIAEARLARDQAVSDAA